MAQKFPFLAQSHVSYNDTRTFNFSTFFCISMDSATRPYQGQDASRIGFLAPGKSLTGRELISMIGWQNRDRPGRRTGDMAELLPEGSCNAAFALICNQKQVCSVKFSPAMRAPLVVEGVGSIMDRPGTSLKSQLVRGSFFPGTQFHRPQCRILHTVQLAHRPSAKLRNGLIAYHRLSHTFSTPVIGRSLF